MLYASRRYRKDINDSADKSDADSYGNGNHASGIAYANRHGDGDPASADAKAAAHAVSSADAVSEWVKSSKG